MTSAELIERIVPEMPLHQALECFVAACKRHDTLFITYRWFAPRKEKLLALLSDPITADEAHVLRELLCQRVPFEVAFDWLAEKPLSWEEYQKAKTAMAEHNRWRTTAEGIFPWEDVDACRLPGKEPAWPADQPLHECLKSKTCPCCSALLTSIFFRRPAWTWRKLCGRAGWLGLCDRCHFQVEFFLDDNSLMAAGTFRTSPSLFAGGPSANCERGWDLHRRAVHDGYFPDRRLGADPPKQHTIRPADPGSDLRRQALAPVQESYAG